MLIGSPQGNAAPAVKPVHICLIIFVQTASPHEWAVELTQMKLPESEFDPEV